jgi:hypothetical protein
MSVDLRTRSFRAAGEVAANPICNENDKLASSFDGVADDRACTDLMMVIYCLKEGLVICALRPLSSTIPPCRTTSFPFRVIFVTAGRSCGDCWGGRGSGGGYERRSAYAEFLSCGGWQQQRWQLTQSRISTRPRCSISLHLQPSPTPPTSSDTGLLLPVPPPPSKLPAPAPRPPSINRRRRPIHHRRYLLR